MLFCFPNFRDPVPTQIPPVVGTDKPGTGPPVIPPFQTVNGGGGGWGNTGNVGSGGEGGNGGPVVPPHTGKVVQAGPAIPGADGTRAAAVAGTFLGLLALGSGLAWALYKFKPGLLSGVGGGGGPSMSISAPRATTNYQLVKTTAGPGTSYRAGFTGGGGASAVNGGVGIGLGAGSASVSTQTLPAMGPVGADMANFRSISGSSVSGSGIAGIIAGGNSVMRPTQTDLLFLGLSPPPPGGAAAGGGGFVAIGGGSASAAGGSAGYAGGGSSAYGMSMSETVTTKTTTTKREDLQDFDLMDLSNMSATSGGSAQAGGYGGGYGTAVKTLASSETQTTEFQGGPVPSAPGYNTIQGQGAGYGADMSSTMFSSSSYNESSSFNQSNAMSTQQRARTLSPPMDAGQTLSG